KLVPSLDMRACRELESDTSRWRVSSLPSTTPPRFPYTTLFRSEAPKARSGALQTRDRHKLRCKHRAWGGPGSAVHRAVACGNTEDRKSTRLNSSHQIISYAVFCWKKASLTG